MTPPPARPRSRPTRGPRASRSPSLPERRGWLRVGQKVTATFRGLAPDGAAVGVAGPHHILVPFGAPGEAAVVEVVRGGPQPQGKIVSLIRRSPQTQVPRCRHFGVCGGCQWQHLSYDAQLQHKTALVREALASAVPDPSRIVTQAVGAGPWGYRDRLQATVARRGERLVTGFHVSGGDVRVINVRECPIQHDANVEALEAVRAAVAALGWPAFDPATRRGLVRGVIIQRAFHTGEVMVVLAATEALPDRMAPVRLLRGSIPELRSLVLSRSSRGHPEPIGRLELLWGREYLEDAVAGVRVRRYATASMPPNPLAAPLWVEAVASSLEVQDADTVVDAACEEGFMAVALAPRAARVIGIAPNRDMMHRAWQTAAMNDVTSCAFYTRAPEGVLAKLVGRGERLDAALLTSRGRPAGREVIKRLADAGVRRLALAGSSLPLLVEDLRAAAAAGYRPTAVRPVDLLPQTSRIHCAAALVRG